MKEITQSVARRMLRDRNLRKIADEIGVSASTLSRFVRYDPARPGERRQQTYVMRDVNFERLRNYLEQQLEDTK